MEFIGVGAFSGCISLESIVIPKGVTKLSKTFRRCASLKSVTLPSTITEIDAQVFGSTDTEADIMQSVKDNCVFKCAIGSYAEQYAKTNGLKIAYSDGPLYTYSENGDGTITITDMADDVEIIGTLSVPETFDGKTVTGIGDRAFSGREDIISIMLPSTITKIGTEAFFKDMEIEFSD